MGEAQVLICSGVVSCVFVTWQIHQPAVRQRVGGPSAAEKRTHQTGSWALRGQVHFYPNGASRFDVMRTRNDLIRNCQFSLNFISPVSPLTASFLFSHSGSLVFFNFELEGSSGILNVIFWLDGYIEVYLVNVLLLKSCVFATLQLIFHLMQFLWLFSFNQADIFPESWFIRFSKSSWLFVLFINIVYFCII